MEDKKKYVPVPPVVRNPQSPKAKAMREKGLQNSGRNLGRKIGHNLKKRELRKKKMKFAQRYLENGGKATEAYRYATGEPALTVPLGASKAEASGQRWKALRMKNDKVTQHYMERIENLIEEEAPKAVKKLAKLRDSAKEEGVQLQASKAILDNFNANQKRKADAMKGTDPKGQTNILIANMSDDELAAAITKLVGGPEGDVSGGEPQEVQDGPRVLDGELSGVSRSGSVPPGTDGDDLRSGEDDEARPVPPTTGTPEVDDDNNLVCDSENPEGPEHSNPDYEQSS